MHLFICGSLKKTLTFEINLFSGLFMIFCCLVGIVFWSLSRKFSRKYKFWAISLMFYFWGVCMCGLQVCVCMHHVCACALEGHQRASCILSWSTNTGCWAILDAGDLGPLEEHHHLLPPQPSLLPIISVVTSRLASITRNLGAGCHRLLYSVLPFGLSDRTLGVSNHSDH